MAELLASDDTYRDGAMVRSVRFFDDGTVEVVSDGKVVETRPQTDDEVDRFAPVPPSDADRLAALEQQNADLLAALAKATTLAQVRAAAVNAADLA